MSDCSHIDLDGLYRRVEEHEQTFKHAVSKLREQADCVPAGARKLAESWSGSGMGRHTALYFGNFEKPGGNRFDVEWGCLHGTPRGRYER